MTHRRHCERSEAIWGGCPDRLRLLRRFTLAMTHWLGAWLQHSFVIASEARRSRVCLPMPAKIASSFHSRHDTLAGRLATTFFCHRERSAAISGLPANASKDCFVVSLLAMTHWLGAWLQHSFVIASEARRSRVCLPMPAKIASSFHSRHDTLAGRLATTFFCHRERSAAISGLPANASNDCFVVSLLAMTHRRHCERSEAIWGGCPDRLRLPRRCAPRNDILGGFSQDEAKYRPLLRRRRHRAQTSATEPGSSLRSSLIQGRGR